MTICPVECVFKFIDIRQSNVQFYQWFTAQKAIYESQNILFFVNFLLGIKLVDPTLHKGLSESFCNKTFIAFRYIITI